MAGGLRAHRSAVIAGARGGGLAAGRRDAVGVEDRVDRAQPVDGALERLRVPHLDDEAVLDHRVRDDAARLDDVEPGLGERAREVLEQAVAVPRVDLQLDLEGGLVVAVPGDRDEAVGVLAQRGDVRAVLAVDRDAAAERDVAEDRVARHRAAALGEAERDVGDAFDLDAVLRGARVRAPVRAAALVEQGVGGGGLLDAGLALLEALENLVDDDLGRDLRPAERDVEVVGLLEAHLADDVREQRRAGQLLRRQAGLVEVLLQQLAAGVLGVLARLGLEPGADLVARAGGLDHREPVARRAPLALGGEHLDDVARLQLVVQRHDLAVDLGADAAVADVGVDLVGEVEWGRADGERLDLALGREDVDLVLHQLGAQRVGELLGVVDVLLPVEQALEPLELVVGGVDDPVGAARALLVAPVRGDAVLGRLVHVAGADLDLQRPPLGPDHRGVQRLVHVELRHRHHVLEAAGERLPERVDDADGAVAVLHRVDDDAHRGEVVDLVELAALAGHLRVDRVKVLGAARDLGADAERLELLVEVAARLGDVALALLALLVDEALDLLVLARVQRLEREVLELPLDRVDTEAVRERRVDLQGLLRLVDLLLLRHRLQRAHVVEAVGELDQDDPDVRGPRDHHLAVVLGLRLVARLEGDAGELGDAVDEAGDLLAERGAHLLERGAGVLDRVVEQRRAQRLRVEAHARADLRHADGMGDEVLARLAALVGVVLAGEHERLDHCRAVDGLGDLVGVLLDDREEVAEQLALERGEVARGLERDGALRPGPVDGPVRGDADARSAVLRAGQAAALSVLLARYVSPSSSRCW